MIKSEVALMSSGKDFPWDQILGCLLGGALGDAIGACYENIAVSGDVPTEWPAVLHITDDTQLTLATCESVLECGEVRPESIAEHFLRWFRQRRLTRLGSSTLKALRELDVGGHWALTGAVGEHTAGNGAAMRIAPLAFLLDPDDYDQRRTIRDVCRITHHHEEAYIGALAILRAIRLLATGASPDETLIRDLIDKLPDSRVRDRLIVIGESRFTLQEYTKQFGSTGYVVDSVPLAILAAIRQQGFQATLRAIVQCGGDTDTVASLYGPT